MAHVASLQDKLAAAAAQPGLLAALRMHLADGEAAATLEEFNTDDDELMMYEFKVRRCPRARAHEWTLCPYAHRGEAARRRDPRRVAYTGEPCPDFRRRPGGACPRGTGCPFAHGTFEMWLHPSRYRTRPCRAGVRCARPICFFAHNDLELRVVSNARPMLSPRSPLTMWDSLPLSPSKANHQLQPADQQSSMVVDIKQYIRAMQELNARKAVVRPTSPSLQGRRRDRRGSERTSQN
ncbi:hypothetical protein ABZP36_027660 [Zizania latifolia]